MTSRKKGTVSNKVNASQLETGIDQSTYLIVEATPLRLIMSSCSVNGMIFARGYSRREVSGWRGLTGRGVQKNSWPIVDWKVSQ